MNLRNYPNLTDRIEGPGIPSVNQRWFCDELERRVGCRILWECRRKVFCVLRPIGGSQGAVSYPIELGNQHYPLTEGILSTVTDVVRISDAFNEKDGVKAMEIHLRKMRTREAEEHARLVADMAPAVADALLHQARRMRDGARASARAFWHRGADGFRARALTP